MEGEINMAKPLQEITPPDEEKIREYVIKNKKRFSLIDFAWWVIKNANC